MWSSDSDSEDDQEAAAIVRRPRVYKDRISYARLEDSYDFNERFRLTAGKLELLRNILGQSLERPTKRSRALSVDLQLQAALRWLGTGAQYHAVGDMHGISKASVCRIVQTFVAAVNQILYPDYVKWPDDVHTVAQKFYNIAGMPLVCGCADGTLIPIDAPTEHEEVFVDRHGNHSINCLAVCGPDLRFYYSTANWPGSTHDARVLRNSSLYAGMENGWRPLPNGIILGDSAYPVKNWLIPPVIINANDDANERFLRAHKSTRRVIENAFGILKEKFPCLNHIRTQPRKACQIFQCCVALCNFAREIDDADEDVPEQNENDEDYGHVEEHLDNGAQNTMQRILAYFRM